MFKGILLVFVTLFVIGCGVTAKTSKGPSRDDYETKNKANERYSKQIRESEQFQKGIRILVKELMENAQRNSIGLYGVTVEEFRCGNETSQFGKILKESIIAEMSLYLDTLERHASKISVPIEVIQRTAIQQQNFISNEAKSRTNGAIRTIVSGTYVELTPIMVQIFASIYATTGETYAANEIQVPISSNLRNKMVSDQTVERLDNNFNNLKYQK